MKQSSLPDPDCPTFYTYFFIGTEDDLPQLKSEGDLLDHIEERDPMVGGFISHERIDALPGIFLKRSDLLAIRTPHGLSTASPYFRFDEALTHKLARAQPDELFEASVIWDETSWVGTDVNRMDLAGILLELSSLSRIAVEKNNQIYFVIAET